MNSSSSTFDVLQIFLTGVYDFIISPLASYASIAARPRRAWQIVVQLSIKRQLKAVTILLIWKEGHSVGMRWQLRIVFENFVSSKGGKYYYLLEQSRCGEAFGPVQYWRCVTLHEIFDPVFFVDMMVWEHIFYSALLFQKGNVFDSFLSLPALGGWSRFIECSAFCTVLHCVYLVCMKFVPVLMGIPLCSLYSENIALC